MKQQSSVKTVARNFVIHFWQKNAQATIIMYKLACVKTSRTPFTAAITVLRTQNLIFRTNNIPNRLGT